ncbi:MAG: hypothetical protein WCH37_05710 [Synechococcaceae cyanobacterium ELA182]
MIFNGSIDDLQELVASLGIPCRWQSRGAFQMAVFEDGVSNLKLNWWPGDGRLALVGDPAQREDLVLRLQALLKQHPDGEA